MSNEATTGKCLRGAGVLICGFMIWADSLLGAEALLVPPYPPSAVIKTIEWAPTNTIVIQARDGDNWPVTWADDDAIYTTWGDGTGFVPKVEKKLSCGFARVTGSPLNQTATRCLTCLSLFSAACWPSHSV